MVIKMKILYEDRFEKDIPVANYYGYKGLGANGLHLHRHIETQYIIDGSVDFTVDDRVYHCSDGMLIVFPYQPHANVRAKEIRHVSAIINPNSFECYAPTFFDYYPKNNFLPSSALPAGLRELIEYACAVNWNKSHPYRERLMNDIAAVIVGQALSSLELVSRRDSTGSESISTVGRIINYCVTHLTEDLSLEALSKEFFLDRSYISRLFRKKLGVSYVEFISAQRVSSACEMLSKTSKPITEIAYDCGFRNQSSFNRVFLAQRGMTPTEYRKKQL